MNKFNSIFGKILQADIFKRGIVQSSSRDKVREEGKRIYLLAAICRNVILPVRTGPLTEGDMRRTGKQFRQTEASWSGECAEPVNIILCERTQAVAAVSEDIL